jgi:hypothetical protein
VKGAFVEKSFALVRKFVKKNKEKIPEGLLVAIYYHSQEICLYSVKRS